MESAQNVVQLRRDHHAAAAAVAEVHLLHLQQLVEVLRVLLLLWLLGVPVLLLLGMTLNPVL
jgi:hypothetical protein